MLMRLVPWIRFYLYLMIDGLGPKLVTWEFAGLEGLQNSA